MTIHDVAPPFAAEVHRLMRVLAPLVGTKLSVALVPAWHGNPTVDRELLQLVQGQAAEWLSHGYTHNCAFSWHPLAVVTQRANEFSWLPRAVAEARLRAGQHWFTRYFGQPARGFVAPAWQRGAINAAMLARVGMQYIAGFAAAEHLDGRRVRLATWSWDLGRLWRFHAAAELLGQIVALRGAALPCFVFHPRDLHSGAFVWGIRRIAALLANGWQPMTFANLLEAHIGT